MGALQECTVIRQCDSMKFTGTAWSNVRGYEAFWYEGDGVRHTHFFAPDGNVYGMFKQYRLQLNS